MKVNFGGIVPLSTVDWPGRSALVVFLRGCPLRCPFCHNLELRSGETMVDFQAIASRVIAQVKGEPPGKRLAELAGRSLQLGLDEASERVLTRPMVDALVLSGGEPLLQPQATARFARLARSIGLHSGIETSGCYPRHLETLLRSGLIDKVFLDIKATIAEPDYLLAAGVEGMAKNARQSLEVCMQSGVAFEVRTTVFPEMLSVSQALEIADMLHDLRSEYPESRLGRLVLQQGVAREGMAFEPVPVQALQEMAQAIGPRVEVQIRANPVIKWKL